MDGGGDHSFGANGPLPVTRRRVMRGLGALGGLAALQSEPGTAHRAQTATVVIRANVVDPPFLSRAIDTIVELKAEAEASQRPIVDYVANIEGVEVRNRFWLANALLLEVDTALFDLVDLSALNGVEAVHENLRFAIPEPFGGDGGSEPGETTYGLGQLDVAEAQSRFDSRGAGARIAVLDTGVDPDHPDITIDAANFAEFDPEGTEVQDPTIRDTDFHGTHVSGTATGGDSSGTAIGVAPDATLLHGLVIPGGVGTFAQIVAGMQWAVENEADVVNLSLGAEGYFAEMIEPVRNAQRAGTVVVSASGNAGDGTSASPANVYESFAVGATNEAETVAAFSGGEEIVTDEDWGVVAPDRWPAGYLVPDAAAPGVDVLSAVPLDHPEAPYAERSGTSMATPHVSGILGLMSAAAAEPYSPSQMKAALSTTTQSSGPASSAPDTRYGHGIVNALAATSRVAAASGLTGAVTDTEGTPVEGATVDLDGFTVQTARDGRYCLRALPGKYDISVDAFGYRATTRTATVTDTGFTRVDITLSDTTAVELLADQPEGIEAGNEFTVRLRVANVESLMIDLAGEYQGGADLSVAGEPARFGEPLRFDGPRSGELSISVATDTNGFGDLELVHTLGGMGQSIEVTSGPTAVFAESVQVAVVDVEEGPVTDDVVAMLDRDLHPRFSVNAITPDEALSEAGSDRHEVYVVQNLGDDATVVAAFADAAASADVGVVYLDQYGSDSDAVSQLSAATGDPRRTVDGVVERAAPAIEYTVRQSHPLLEGVAEPGGSVPITRPDPVVIGAGFSFGGFHTAFEDYRGEVAGATVADVEVGIETSGAGLAVDDLTRTVLASSLGVGVLVDRADFTDEGRTILVNAVEHVARSPAVEAVETPATRIAPGDATSLVVDFESLVELEVGTADRRFVEEDDLRLTIDGEERTLGTPVRFDEPVDGELELTISCETDGLGRFAFDTRFVTLGERDEPVATAVTFPPTSVYEPPLTLPDQTEDLQAAVDLVQPGDEVVLADGTYEVDSPDRAGQTGILIETPGITVRAATGAAPSVIHARELSAPRIIHVDADDVTIDGIDVNVLDGAVHEPNATGTGILVGEFTSGVTVRNLVTGGTFGVLLESTTDVTVENVTVVGSITGVGTDIQFTGIVENATIDGITVTDSPRHSFTGGVVIDGGATGVTVTDCEIDVEAGDIGGIVLNGSVRDGEGCHVVNNTIVGRSVDEEPSGVGNRGVVTNDLPAVVEDNAVLDTYAGVQVGDRLGLGVENVDVLNNDLRVTGVGYVQTGDYAIVEENVIDAPVGVDLGDGDGFDIEADQVLVRFNDFSATETPLVGRPERGPATTAGPFDCRRNHLGDRRYGDTIADGEIVYDPFLTAAPSEVELPDPTSIGTDLTLDPGTTYGLGIPGPTDRTIYEVLGTDADRGFTGDLEYWDLDSQQWQPVSDTAGTTLVDTLDAFRVTPDDGVRAIVDFQRNDGTPPENRDDTPGQKRLVEGSNVVAAPLYGPTSEVFDDDSIVSVTAPLSSPGGQLGTAEREPFTGYRVEVSEDTVLGAALDRYDPTMTDLYESLGLSPSIHDSAGRNDGVVGDNFGDRLTAVMADAPDRETAAEALATLVGRQVEAAVDDPSDEQAYIGAMRATVAAAERRAAGSSEVLREATRRVTIELLRTRFDTAVRGGDAPGRYATETERRDAARRGSD